MSVELSELNFCSMYANCALCIALQVRGLLRDDFGQALPPIWRRYQLVEPSSVLAHEFEQQLSVGRGFGQALAPEVSGRLLDSSAASSLR